MCVRRRGFDPRSTAYQKMDWGHSVGVQGQIISYALGWRYHLIPF